MTQMLAFAGLALTGYAIAHWLTRAGSADATIGLYSAPGASAAAPGTVFGPAAAALVMGGVCLASALTLTLRARRNRARDSMHDPVTGLYGPRYVAATLPALMERDDSSGRSRLALVRVDIDRIGDIRERHGESAVRELLGATGRHIRSQTRGADLPSAIEGCGFAVYLRCAEVEQAGAFCRRLTTLLRSEQFEWDGEVIKVAVSVGVALREIGETWDTLQDRAEQKLAHAKQAGGGQIAC